MLNVIVAFCMLLSGLGFNLNATLEGAGIDAPLATKATEDGPLSDLLIAVNDLSFDSQVSDEEFRPEQRKQTSSTDYIGNINNVESDLLAGYSSPVGCGPRIRRCRPKARCCKPRVRHFRRSKCCQKPKRCCEAKVRKCRPKCHKKCHKVRRCAPKVRSCKPKCHPKPKRCCKPRVRKCNPKVRRCEPRRPIVKRHVAPVGCGPRRPIVKRHVAPAGCGPRVVQRVRKAPTVNISPAYSSRQILKRESTVRSHYPIQQQTVPVETYNDVVDSGYPIQQAPQIKVPPIYRAPQVKAPVNNGRASVSSIW
ncbi:MAG: hypothetical protein QNJ31_00635 [Candidatus Caenarcaniphilales bacterium]|nr:hypothetical protein [Candidatus Caenarcaniphilales bacterium]